MKTKLLILTAAVAVAGAIAVKAQTVYSVNVVGYVNVTLAPGFNLIANPLNTTNNTIGSLLPGIPGLTVYKYISGSYANWSFDEYDLVWYPNDKATLNPGEGAFVFNPTATNIVVTFVGEVLQGLLTNDIPVGYSIRSSMVPQTGTINDILQLQGEPGDTIYKYKIETKNYESYTFDEFELVWYPDSPVINVGEAFFLNRFTKPTQWIRNFTVQ